MQVVGKAGQLKTANEFLGLEMEEINNQSTQGLDRIIREVQVSQMYSLPNIRREHFEASMR